MALLSRVAESLFWLGRYVERAESMARLLDVTFHGRLEPHASEVVGATNTWEALVTTLGLTDSFDELGLTADEATVIEFLTVSRANASSIVSSLAAARENARGVRDFLSSETWIAINRLYHSTAQQNVHLILADGLYDFCDGIRQGAGLFHGTCASTSLHDEGWHWLQAGVYLERSDMVTRIVDSKYHLLLDSLEEVGGSLDRHQWMALLRSLSGYEAFRRTHAGPLDPAPIVEFLLLDVEFPRSLRANVDALVDAIERATDGAPPRLRNPALRQLAGLQSQLQYETVDTLIGTGLHQFLASTQDTLAATSTSLSEAFFWAATSAA
jgi:uncharacterized alpha-E superfamily protein